MKKSLVGWTTKEFLFKEHFYIDNTGEINLPFLFVTAKQAKDYSKDFWNHSGEVKKIRLTVEEL